jgi:uncharacterized protein (TIGR03382 family)
MRAFVGLAACLLGLTASAQQYQYLDFKMLHTEANPFGFWLDARPGKLPAGLRLDLVETASVLGAKAWGDVSCASTALRYQGELTQDSLTSAYDDYSATAIWITSPGDPLYDLVLGGGVASAASVPTRYEGALRTCDIFLNAVDYRWSYASPTPADHMDLQSALAHEFGHCQGLDHNSHDPEAIMFDFLLVGATRRVPNASDRQHLCSWSPKTGAVGSPCTLGQSCGAEGLTCVTVPTADGGTSPPFCSHPCSPETSPGCELPYVCGPSNAIPETATICLPPSGQGVDIGRPCTAPDQCGAANAECIFENSRDLRPSGVTAWQDGYCTQPCGEGHPACPAASECLEFSPGVSRCLLACRVGRADCREGYTCFPQDEGSPVCLPICGSDADCGGGSICRTCDGTCMALGAPGASIGDRCDSDAQCGTGQECTRFGGGDMGVCTQRCESDCTACPTGSTCHRVGPAGERYCLQDCTAGTCASGLQCAPLESGAGCHPPCSTDTQCPVGNRCDASGQCVDPNAGDGGCGSLCRPDAGGPLQPPPDAGVAPPVQGGCGCTSTPVSSLAALALFGWLHSLRRRSRS